MSFATAQTYFYLESLSITPPEPAPGEDICITVSGLKSTPCVYEEIFEVYAVSDGELMLDMCFQDTGFCLPVLWPWDTTYCIPGLPVGSYILTLGGCNHDAMGLTFSFNVAGAETPQAGFSADPPQGCVPAVIAFTNQSVNANIFQWNFGDGSTSTEENPTHVFSSAGSYNVILTATNSGSGVSDQTTSVVVVFPQPQVELGADTTITTDQTLTLNAGAGFSSYLWNDGSTTAFLQIVGSQLSPGTYSYAVTVTNGQGCQGTDQIEVTVTLPSGLTETPQFPEFLVYPNPVSDILYYSTEADIVRVEWVDMSGRVLYQVPPDNKRYLRVPDVEDGVYLLKAFTSEYSYGVKVVVER